MMVTIISIIIIVLVITVIWFLKEALKGAKRTLGQLHRPISDLLSRGFDGGVLIIEHSKTGRFIQFSKYIKSKEDFGIELAFPKAGWSKYYYSRVKDVCKNFDLNIREDFSCGEGELTFLFADFDKDVDSAFKFSKAVFKDVFKVNTADKVHVRLRNASATA
ncbi:hypothetical protein BTJ40_10735 [Microbulbifer sp. A4B17]|uniref:hypothetical protein n=1 Tax=Microbulbifer sp. A4B17 TaxID=359370 RepID=UPI000D52BA52|nr:hypothetical protein [Microbulbifer sp. A4B17]AWF81255.1 hypothetical protein BTJ40_10735 [Microbulbifer sp. A4B17]